MRKLISTILALCMVLCLLPVTAAADDASLPVNKWDVSSDETYYSELVYKVDKDAIEIYAKGANQVYELTGTTNRPIRLWGGNSESESGTIYLRLNNAEINGGIVVENSPVKLVIEVVDGTTNTLTSVSANDLTITGAGTLKAAYLSVTQKTRTSYMPSKLYIKDTTIVVNEPASARRTSEWNGECVLDGGANVTYISNSDFSPLQVGVKNGDPTHSLTMKGDSKLYCLQGVETSAYSVSGLEAFDAAITLQDNAYLEAEGRATTGSYAGYGVITQSSITVENNATITGSWIETSGKEEFTAGNDSITNSVLFNGKTGKVIGNATLPADAAVAQGMTLDIPAGTTLTVPEGKTFTNDGTVKLLGDLYHSGNDTTKGDLICNSHSGGTATCTEPAKCDICQKPYGDKDSTNHVGLKHTDAKDATLAEAGNIEYWFCPACGKYFADANAANEITRESTVIPALKAPGIKPADGKGVYTKNSGKDLAFTTENMPEEIKVKVGSTVLTEGKDYTVSNGSIVLKTSYLESLGYGSYTLMVTDANGVELARTSFTKSFTVRPAQQPALSGGKTAASGSGVTSAGTGDAGVAMYAVSAVLSLTGSAWVVGKKRK